MLPPPDPPFRGEIEVAYKDSTADCPEPLRAPKGAPNVLLIMGDDIGYGHMSAFGGPANTPVFDRLAKQGLQLHQLPHHGRLLGVACLPCSPGATPIPSAWAASRRPRSGSRDTTPPSRAAPRPCSRSCGRTATAPPGSARPTSRPSTKSRPQDRSTAGRSAWAPNTSTASSAPA